MEYQRCQNEMKLKISRIKWKTILHTSIPISFQFLCIAYTEKHRPIRVSGHEKYRIIPIQYCHGSIPLQYLRLLLVDKLHYFSCVSLLCRQYTHCIIVSSNTYIAVCSIDVICYAVWLTTLKNLIFFLSLTICQVILFFLSSPQKFLRYLLFIPV